MNKPIKEAEMTSPHMDAAPGMQEFLTESVRFQTSRLQEIAEFQQALFACTNPVECIGIQIDFWKQALEDYTAEAKRLGSLTGLGIGNRLTGEKSEHARRYDDIPV